MKFIYPSVLLLVSLAPDICSALEIRDYSPTRHDRFTADPRAFNPDAWIDAKAYAAVGWSMTEPKQQVVLVSPQHFLLPTHWDLKRGELVSFMAPNGGIWSSTIESTTPIRQQGRKTGLSLGRFLEPLPYSSQIRPLPYLRLPSENDYLGMSLQVFGADDRVGAATLAGFADLKSGPALSRVCRFDYPVNAGGGDDCRIEAGDTGGATLAWLNDKPVLVGTHSTVQSDDAGAVNWNYDVFVPRYAPLIDALMKADGWRMIPSDVIPADLRMDVAITPQPLRRTQPATLTTTISNPTPREDGNVEVTFNFFSDSPPDSISADGWLVQQTAAAKWTMRRATMAASASTTITAHWNAVPEIPFFGFAVTIDSDATVGFGVPWVYLTEAPVVE